MTQERITQTERADGSTHTTHTTVINDEPRRSGVGKGLVLLLILAVVITCIWIFSQVSQAEVAKDQAIAGAANEVSEAAQSVGEAAEGAADNLDGAE